MSILDNEKDLIQETDMRDYIKQLEQKIKDLENYIEILKSENNYNYSEYAKDRKCLQWSNLNDIWCDSNY